MPEAKTEAEKGSLSPSFSLKAAIVATVASALLLGGIFLAGILPGKHAGWQRALPTRRMSAEKAEDALVRARYLHEAAIRPRLILAGFASDEDLTDPGGRDDCFYGSDEPVSSSLVQTLWAMRALPELHKAMLRGLLDTTRDRDERLRDFHTHAALLKSAAESLVAGKDSAGGNLSACDIPRGRFRDYGSLSGWSAYFANDPRLKLTPREERGYRPGDSGTAGKTPEGKALYEQNLALARRVLPVILENVRQEMRAQDDLAREKSAQNEGKNGDDRSCNAYGGSSREHYLDELGNAVNVALSTMGKQRADSGFLSLAGDVMAAREGTFLERCAAVPLIAEKPGLPVSEYLFWGKYRDDLRGISRCVGTNPGHYAFLIGCCGELGAATKKMMKARGSFMLGSHDGPGMTLTRAEAFQPERNLEGNLYLLADMSLALEKAPPCDLSRAHPIFRGMLLRHMENQPLVLPLDPKNEGDRKVIDWYASDGWKQGRTLLFSATGSPADIARHWGSVHLLWWPSGKKSPEKEPALAYLHPESGHFMLAMVPNLKGKDVSRFFGPVTGLWFGRRTVDKTGWVEEMYEARPVAAPARTAGKTPLRSPLWEKLTGAKAENEKPVYTEATATIILGEELRRATTKTYSHNYRIDMARNLERSFKDSAAPPREMYAFVDDALNDLGKWEIEGDGNLAQAVEYLWRFRENPEAVKIIRDTLAQKQLRPCERMRKVRRSLGLPEQKKGGC